MLTCPPEHRESNIHLSRVASEDLTGHYPVLLTLPGPDVHIWLLHLWNCLRLSSWCNSLLRKKKERGPERVSVNLSVLFNLTRACIYCSLLYLPLYKPHKVSSTCLICILHNLWFVAHVESEKFLLVLNALDGLVWTSSSFASLSVRSSSGCNQQHDQLYAKDTSRAALNKFQRHWKPTARLWSLLGRSRPMPGAPVELLINHTQCLGTGKWFN